MATWHKSLYFEDGEGSTSTATIAGGLPSPLSLMNEAQTTLQEISPNVGKGDQRQSIVHEVNPGKRKAESLLLSDLEDDSALSPTKIRREISVVIQSNEGKHAELKEAIANILAPPKPVWGEDIVYRHSDNEDSDFDSDSDADPISNSTPLQSRGVTPDRVRHHFNETGLNPGIIRIRPINRTSSPRRDSTRYALKFDPTIPRPGYAINPQFGNLPNLYVGKRWHSRIGASWDGTHVAPVAGIAGRVGVGVWSIALSGGYEDDFDEGSRFVYTGCGGRDVKIGNSRRKMRTGPQLSHQCWNKSNLALRENVKNEKPVRVIRGHKGDSIWSPSQGFMYAGLYEVVACWVEAGKSGYDVIRFAFKRLSDQEPLVNGKGVRMPEPDYDSEEWKGWETRLTEERAVKLVAIKTEKRPIPEESTSINRVIKIKLEEQ